MDGERLSQLLDEARAHRLPRRDLLRRGAALGLSAPALAMLAAVTKPVLSRAQDSSNPFGVDPGQSLDVLMWDVGWGDEYALNALEIYKRLYPGVEIEYQGVQRVAEIAQPRFVAGDPPDVIEATLLDRAALVAEGLLADLSDLLAAPAYDTPDKTFGETLLSGTQTDAIFDGKPYAVNFSYGLQGIWYDDRVMQEHGWEYPSTWEDMLALCEEIKTAGLSPWTYQGRYPSYMTTVLWELIWKNGGIEAIAKIDNLEPDAWRQDAVRASVDALYQLADRDYFMPGTEGLTHTEAQAEWLQGKAVFIPCGTWLENEMKDVIPEGFQMTFRPVPPLAGGAVPFEGVSTFSGQPFVVPAEAKNVAGGKEFIRLLCSKENAGFFCGYAHSLTTIVDSCVGLDLGSAFNSALAAFQAAGDNRFAGPLYPSWYKPLADEETTQMGALLTKQITPDEYIDNVQQMADDIAADDSIPKFTREI